MKTCIWDRGGKWSAERVASHMRGYYHWLHIVWNTANVRGQGSSATVSNAQTANIHRLHHGHEHRRA